MRNKISTAFSQLFKFTSENLILVVIMACVTISILSRAYFDLSYISPDSAHYLRAAREILKGNGFYVYPEWFAAWPIGYPALIAVVAFITRAEIYFASKILSIIIVWIIGILFYKRFGKTAWLYALLMLNVGFRYIFFYTWSETVFILALILLAFTACDIITADNAPLSHYVKLTFIVLLLFLTRYIGAFALIVVALLWLFNLYQIIKRKCKTAAKRLIYLSFSGILASLFIIAYLFLNLRQSGHMTGIPRVPPGPAREIFLDLYRAILIEMDYVFDTFFSVGTVRLSLLLWFALIGFFAYAIPKSKQAIFAREKNIITSLSFLSIGLIYWLSIIVMRFASDFDEFGYRLLFPGSALVFVGFIGLLARNPKITTFASKYSGKIIPAVCLSGFILVALVISPRLQGTSGYQQTKELTLSTYAGIPDGALVLWGDTIHPLFMRDNLHVVNVEADDLASFWAEYSEYQEIYIFIPGMKERLNELPADSDIYAYFADFIYYQNSFAQIR
ncbi:MAG: hypothetical protein FWG91_04885 [Lachnospiraceae bacterium]|nr:hypothetical protein [Lachnospiraceae bacterium]